MCSITETQENPQLGGYVDHIRVLASALLSSWRMNVTEIASIVILACVLATVVVDAVRPLRRPVRALYRAG